MLSKTETMAYAGPCNAMYTIKSLLILKERYVHFAMFKLLPARH